MPATLKPRARPAARVPTEFVVTLENRPGTFADLVDVLGREGVNIVGIECQTLGDYGTAHFVVDAEAKAEAALKRAGVRFKAYRALTVRLPNRPGELSRACRTLAEAGVNIEGIFGTTSLHLHEAEFVIKTHDIDGARKALGLPPA